MGSDAKRWLTPTRLTAAALVLLIAGYFLGRAGGPEPADDATFTEASSAEVVAEQATVWTCSMHPQVRQPNPGLCPICGMDLIPLESDMDTDSDRPVLTMSEASKALLNLQTVPAERRFVTVQVRMVGKVDYDETRLGYITAWVGGRIDRLYVDYTGVQVKKGDHMVSLYSPELLTAQQELRRASKSMAALSGASESVRSTAQATVEAAREKLRRWGLTEAQIEQAENESELSDHVTIYAPMGGTVIERSGTEGMYVETGTRIYTIADLSKVWVRLNAYESDLPWLHYGQSVTFTSEAYPGETFEGQIAFIDPILNRDTRTVDIRVNVPNEDGRLKPGMFVRGTVRAEVAADGRVMDPELAGKWISPMHPEIIKDGPGSCDICGMALVPAEELGYVPEQAAAGDLPLVIPASAPLITGKRAVVYVELPNTDKPTYEGREIVLGARAGDYYTVEAGLREGDLVVTNGNFKIDSALQIQAKPSMMSPPSPEETGPDVIAIPESFAGELNDLVNAYVTFQERLADDDLEGAQAAAETVLQNLRNVEALGLSGEAATFWEDSQLAALVEDADALALEGDIDALRSGFLTLSNALVEAVRAYQLTTEQPLYLLHCPMADDDRGADWLQVAEEVDNPYYGAMMRTCGEILGRVDAAPQVMSEAGDAHAGHNH